MSRRYPCIYCTEDLHCTKYSDDDCESWRVLGPCTAETPSNGDKIRRMTDEELAEWIETIADCRMCKIDEGHCSGGGLNSRASCMIKWLDWLQQEASDG